MSGILPRWAIVLRAAACAGLLVAGMVRNRFIEVANRDATELLAPRDSYLVGHPVAAFLLELHRALRREEGPQLRTSMQCRGHRANGEPFMADVWFST